MSVVAPGATRRVAVRGTLLVFAAVGVAVALYLIAVTPPTRDSLYPKCLMYQTTGLHCPGCGTGRALHFALNGELLRAAQFNLLAAFVLPLLLFLSLPRLLRWAVGKPQLPARLHSWWIWLLFAVIMLFGICRNIPFSPFKLLAPTELP